MSEYNIDSADLDTEKETNNKDKKDFQRKIEKLFVHKLFPGSFIVK